MMTVLVGLFIVLYAMGVTDQAKFNALKDSLASGFGNGQPALLNGSAGVVKDAGAVPNSPQDSGVAGPVVPVVGPSPAVSPSSTPAVTPDPVAQNVALARKEAARLQDVAAQIEARLTAVGMAGQVRYGIDARGLVIALVSNDVFFTEGSAVLQPAAGVALDAAAPVLAAITDEISVEGHANMLPVAGRYETNWELSADRATRVLRRLVESDGVSAARIYSVGFGDSRPLSDATLDGLAINRRVDLVVHSPLPESVRTLLPAVVAGTGK
jgi:chemotaxis protein MotB